MSSSNSTSATTASSLVNVKKGKVNYTTVVPAPALWWFGGVASGFGAMCTHPLDTLKIRLQTATVKASLVKTFVNVVKNEGFMTLYAGLSASLLRQATYSTTRFGVYEALIPKLKSKDGSVPFYKRLLAAIVGGMAGGIVGTPADLTNVRMQDDGRLPIEQRRGYKNAFHGIYLIYKQEGPLALFSGLAPNVQRAMVMTAGQIATYDGVKQQMLDSKLFQDNVVTHFLASTMAALVATTLSSPLDVMKTRMMTAEKGKYSGSIDVFLQISRTEGPLAFFKGWIPAFTRLGPHTVLTFLAFERLRIWRGMYQDYFGKR
ncbi:hypothetical protein HDU76_004107 [Blyttiomyces sp. JEL0837]|nr:hypothetical protein HDU76_004107 [Blyttiomyces sp. JEL0837]